MKIRRNRLPSHIAEPLQTVPDLQSPQNILHALNDDCLRAIFERSELDIDDLCAIANSCQRFHTVAADIFQHKYRGQHKAFIDTMLYRAAPLWQWDEYFHAFGGSLESIDIKNQCRNGAILLHFIAKNCPNIKQITCQLIDRKSAVELRGLFARLQTLQVTLREKVTFDDIITAHVEYSLERLTIMTSYLDLTPIKLPQLTELELEYKELYSQDGVSGFFRLNDHLTKLHLNKKSYQSATFSTISCLCNLTNLRELALGGSSAEHNHYSVYTTFRAFGQLNELTIANNIQSKFVYESSLKAMRDAKIPLKCLNLTSGVDELNIDLIGQISSIRVLRINMHRLHNDQLIALVKDLRQLNEIQVTSQNITMDGIRRFIQLAQPSTTAQFELTAWSRKHIRHAKYTFRLIDDLLSTHDIRLDVVIRIYCKRGEAFRLVGAIVESHTHGFSGGFFFYCVAQPIFFPPGDTNNSNDF